MIGSKKPEDLADTEAISPSVALDERLTPMMAIDLPAPNSSFVPGDHVKGLGWVLSGTPVVEISISASDKVLGYAVYGLYRPDLAEAFPQYANGDHSGFSFSVKLDVPPGDQLSLVVSARFLDGQYSEESIPMKLLQAKPESPARDTALRAPVHLRVDKSVIDTEGALRVTGWVLSKTSLEQVAIYAGTTLLGLAELGIPRTDIAHDWPDYPNSGVAGFAFLLRTPTQLEAAKVVRVEASASGGFVREVVVPLGYEVVENALKNIETLMKLEIDQPKLHAGVIVDPVHSGLRVEGWALAKAGIGSIRGYLDTWEPVEAYYGVRREDVAAVYPDWNNSLWSGFGMSLPSKLLTSGEHVVRIVALDLFGREQSTSFKFNIEQADEAKSPEALRTNVATSEEQLYRRVLSGLKSEPRFLIYMPMKASEMESARVTLEALSRQAYDNWQLVVIADDVKAAATLLENTSAFKLPVLVLTRRTHQRDKGKIPDQWENPSVLCGLLRPGDRLGPDALMEFAIETGLHPAMDFFYSDERRKDPMTGKVCALLETPLVAGLPPFF